MADTAAVMDFGAFGVGLGLGLLGGGYYGGYYGRPYYAAPPVVYAPPPVYYAPPPVTYVTVTPAIHPTVHHYRPVHHVVARCFCTPLPVATQAAPAAAPAVVPAAGASASAGARHPAARRLPAGVSVTAYR